jgi:three-Cys-motif partner protein
VTTPLGWALVWTQGTTLRSDEAGEITHRFGGPWTVIKLAALEKYSRFYTTALKNQGFRLVYADAFAGTGDIAIKVDGVRQFQRGSAQIALEVQPPFHEIIFIEKSLRRCKRLTALRQRFPDRAVSIRHGDANSELSLLCHQLDSKPTRAVLFLDPYGLSVHWETLQSISATRIIDVWYLFPLSGLYRQMAVDSKAIDDGKASAIDSILGTTNWRDALYSPPAQATLFDRPADTRTGGWQAISQFVTTRLRDTFPAVVGPRLLFQDRADGQIGPPLYALYFACSNPHKRAQELSCRAARHILDHT